MPIVPAIPAIIGLGSTIAGGVLGSGAASGAGHTLSAAGQAAAGGVSQAATNAQNAVNNVSAQLNPYLNLGTLGVSTLAGMLQPGGQLLQQFSFDPSQIANTPEYQFQLGQGMEAVQNSAAARGGLFSGNTLKGITQYGQGLASTSYQQAYNNALNTFQTNRNNTLGALLAATGIGQTAEGQNLQSQEYAGSIGLQGALGAGNFWMQGAGGAASGQVGAANALQGMIPGLAQGATTLTGLIPGLGGGGTAGGGGFTPQGPTLGPGVGGIPSYMGPTTPPFVPDTATLGSANSMMQRGPAASPVYSQTLNALRGLQLAA